MDTTEEVDHINAEPTKAFFVEMLTRDIALEQAILDLVDNSVDGAKKHQTPDSPVFEGRSVSIEFNSGEFRILDNCGGFDKNIAREYAFRFGRPSGVPRTSHSIGQFGVGMKRALFKFGNHFIVRSASAQDTWAVDVNVPEWEKEVGWSFPWAEFQPDENISGSNLGTEIVVRNLRPEVSNRFSTKQFEQTIIGLIKSKHRQFVAEGLSIKVNGTHIDASSLYLLVNDDLTFSPGIDEITVQNPNEDLVKIKIYVGVGHSSPREAGWYVICNGRVILEADRRAITGWGSVEDHSNSIVVPSYHNQFARFRGIVSFDSNDSSLIPWNTTKTDVDQDSPIWRQAYARMIEMMRPVITFLNELDSDIDEHTRDKSPLLDFVNKAKVIKPEDLPNKAAFSAPARGTLIKPEKTVKIQYSRPLDQVNFLFDQLSVGSAKAVGERTFDLIYQEMVKNER